MTAIEYFASHSLDSEYLKKAFGVTWDDNKIIIPIYDEDGKLAYCKFRHLNPERGSAKFSFEKGGHPALFCAHKIAKHSSVVLCEGEPDAMRLWQDKIPAVTGTGGVSTFSKKMAELLVGKTVYLCLDNDKAGQSEVEKYCELLEENQVKVKIMSLPEGVKDVSEYLSANSKGDFVELMKQSLEFEDWLDGNEPAEYAIESNDDLLQAEIPVPKWIINKLVPAEGFTFLFGPEGSGKSFYTLTMAQCIAYGEPWLGEYKIDLQTKVLFIDKENSRALTKARLKGLGYEDKDRRIFRVLFPEHFELTDEKGAFSPFLKSLARKVKKEGIGCIVIDSFTDVMVGDENSRGDVQAFFDAFRQIIPNIPFITLHHANKGSSLMPKASQDRVRGSTNIPAQASSMIFIRPVPKTTNEYVLEQTKSRIGKKLPAFKVNMVINRDPENEKETIVSKLMYGGLYEDKEEKSAECMAIINEVLNNQTTIYRKELVSICEEAGISTDTFDRTINSMIAKKEIKKEYSTLPKESNLVVFSKPIEKRIYEN